MSTDNSMLETKLFLRRHFLKKHPPRRVIDCCQGHGKIWQILRSEFPCSYVGFDEKQKKGRLKINSERVLQNSRLEFDTIDIDTYGSPWDHWANLLKNSIVSMTIFLTIGKSQGLARVSKVNRDILGFCFSRHVPESLIKKESVLVISTNKIFLLSEKYGWKTVEIKEAFPQKNARYIGIRLDRV